ncbi:uncharacterized protein METZ01_LOCUS195348 [marine metagenome]|uniref:Uncharacterized protein n=1 Tax=marine metagenome TaxID=408172 RepID=A0A382DX71_9ZZZZ
MFFKFKLGSPVFKFYVFVKAKGYQKAEQSMI